MSGSQRADRMKGKQNVDTKATNRPTRMDTESSKFRTDIAVYPAAVLVLGNSGSGKTSFAQSVARFKAKPVILIGGDAQDYKDLGQKLKLTQLDLRSKEVTEISDKTVIIEDHFAANTEEHARIRYIMSFMCRHRNLTVLLLTHTLMHTSVLNLLPHFKFIVLTASPGSKTALTQIASRSEALDGESAHTELRSLSPYQYLVVHVAAGDCEAVAQDLALVDRSSTDGAVVQERKKLIAKGLDPILKQFPDVASRGKCLLDYVLANLGKDAMQIHPSQFTIEVTPSKTGNRVAVSLADFLVVSQQADTQPSQNEYLMRRYLSERMVMPLVLIPNKKLLSRFKDPQKSPVKNNVP